MNKEIICVYQDCPMCGSRGVKLKKLILDKKLNVRKVSFASPEGKKLCNKAVFQHGIKTMPFFTDGVRFETQLLNFCAKPRVAVIKKTKKAKKTKEVIEHESD